SGASFERAAMGLREMVAQGDRRIGLDADEPTGRLGDRTLERYRTVQALAATDIEDGRPGPEVSGVGQDHVPEDPVTPLARSVSINVRTPGVAGFQGDHQNSLREVSP